MTWYLIGILAILCIISTKSVSSGSADLESGPLNTQIEETQQSEEAE